MKKKDEPLTIAQSTNSLPPKTPQALQLHNPERILFSTDFYKSTKKQIESKTNTLDLCISAVINQTKNLIQQIKNS